MLNWIWAAFFLIAFVVAIWQAAVGGKPDVLKDVVSSLFDSSKTGFEIALGLTGVMSLWLGLMKIAERGGVTELIAWAVGPLFRPPSRAPPRRPRRERRDRHEPLGEHARARQRRHTARLEGDEGAAELEPRARHSHRRDGVVHGHERVVGDARADLDHD